MAQRIEDYAIIGNGATAALVGRNGSIDWLSFPRFDSAACFAALLGAEDHGYWRIHPQTEDCTVERSYRDGTLVLETQFSTSTGAVVVVDCMDRKGSDQYLVRLVRGVRGRVAMNLELVVRFEYGSVVPWVSRLRDGRLQAVAGAERLVLSSPVELRGEGMTTCAQFDVGAGQELAFSATWNHSYDATPHSPDVQTLIENVSEHWRKWSSQCSTDGPWHKVVERSLITLKALTDHKTGGIVAAATTSLPEQIGGPRNWDYRYCWLRDATFTLYAMMESGYINEAKAWRQWLVRAIAGSPDQMQIMYGIAGERRLTEFEIDLPGYENSRPVRIGNAASDQLQLDVYGEVIDALYSARRKGLAELDAAWAIERKLVEHLSQIWRQPDEGLWEIRGKRQHFTHSKVMAWVAVDRAVRTIEEFGADGPVDAWRQLRDQIHATVCEEGFSQKLNSFVQYFGGEHLDASLLLIPLVGFLPPEDERIRGTVAAVERYLLRDGFVARYNTESAVDGLPGDEGVFLACSFWLVDNYLLLRRVDEAKALFEKLLSLQNDVGLLAEEYDPQSKRFTGNMPQAFSHLALVNSAHNFSSRQPGRQRAGHSKG